MNVIAPYPVIMDHIMFVALGYPICVVIGHYMIKAVRAMLRGIV